MCVPECALSSVAGLPIVGESGDVHVLDVMVIEDSGAVMIRPGPTDLSDVRLSDPLTVWMGRRLTKQWQVSIDLFLGQYETNK